MAGADDVVKAALKLIAGGAKEAGPSVAERAAKNIDVFNTANRLGVDTNDITKLQETKRLMDYHKGFMGDVRERAQFLAELQRQMQEQGAFPMEVGTRFTTPHSQKFGHPPHIVTGYYVDPKNPSGRYGYRVRQEHADGNVTEQMLMIRDPKLEALHGPEKWEELQRGFVPMTGPKVVKASGGSIRQGYQTKGRVVGDIVDQALKLVAGSDPQKTVKAYKLFKQREGKLYPLFVDANEEVPLNQWLKAKAGEQAASGQVKSKAGPLAYRPGWHAGDLPTATHIGAKSHGNKRLPPDTRRSDEVWAEVEMADDVDWQKLANERARITKKGTPDPKTAHITDQVPYGGFYRYKTSPTMQGNWMIGGDMRVNRVLTDDEVKAINEAAGVADLPRREGYGPGGWVDDVVKMAGKVIEGEGDNVTRLSDVKSARARDALIKQLKSSINQVKSGYFQAGRQALINQKSLDLHKSGMLPLQQGTIVTPPSTWDMPGDWRVSGYWYDEKDPRRFGYRLQNESGQTYDAAASDPRAGLKRDSPYSFGAGFKAYAGPNAAPPKPVASPVEKPAAIPKPPEVLDAINKEYEGLFGSEDPFKPRAHGGRIAKGPGGWLDDVVKMAGKVISGEGEDAAKAGIRAYHGSPNEISEFKSGMGKTAKDIYLTPFKEDASGYGKNVYEVNVSGKVGDFTPENRGPEQIAQLREAYEGGLGDYFESFDDFLDALDSGDMYQRFGNQHAQNDVVSNLLHDLEGRRRYDAVRIPDAKVGGGMSESIVTDRPDILSIIRKYGIAGASAMLGYNLMEQLDPKQALAASMADQDYQANRPQRSMGGNNSISGALNVARGLNGVK